MSVASADRELYVCPGEDGGRCDLIGPYRGPAPRHYCNFDDDHDGPHECACGHQWTTNNEEN